MMNNSSNVITSQVQEHTAWVRVNLFHVVNGERGPAATRLLRGDNLTMKHLKPSSPATHKFSGQMTHSTVV